MEDHGVGNDLVARLLAYQEASNRHDIEAAVAMFSEDGCIELGGRSYCGEASLRAAHEYDLASATQVEFSDFEVSENVVSCAFTYRDESDRVTGNTGTRSRTTFTFRDGHIERFVNFPPDEEEQARVRKLKAPFYAWARENFPDEVSRPFTFDYETGASLFRVARAYADSQEAAAAD